jgi:lipoprotein-anchoring transpeptidase ErfK/SrfK
MRVKTVFILFSLAFASVLWSGGVAEARSVIGYQGIARGEIVIDTSKRRLYLGIGKGKAISYSVGVGRAGRQWSGRRWITGKRLRPAWSPTADILRDKPGIARVIPGGAPNNPMGAAALLLSGGGQFAIHGTNNPASIGRFVSYGCIRMHNDDVLHLYGQVGLGTSVTVLR